MLKLAASDLQSTISPAATNQLEVPASPGIKNDDMITNDTANVPGAFHTDKGKGMQLGRKQTNTDLFETDSTDDLKKNPWGNDDLIDINADQSDWGKRNDA